MNLRKKIFVFGGSFLIIAILAFRFGVFDKLRKMANPPAKPQPAPTVKAPPPQAPEIPHLAPAKKKTLPAPAVVSPKKTAPKSTAPAIVSSPQTAMKPTAPAEKVANAVSMDALGLGNPFTYTDCGDGHYSPLSGNKQVGLIAIKGIVKIHGGEAWALLHLKDTDRIYYVKKGDVIRISSKSANGIMPTEAYIVVKEVRDSEVELIQQERPDKVIIVR